MKLQFMKEIHPNLKAISCSKLIKLMIVSLVIKSKNNKYSLIHVCINEFLWAFRSPIKMACIVENIYLSTALEWWREEMILNGLTKRYIFCWRLYFFPDFLRWQIIFWISLYWLFCRNFALIIPFCSIEIELNWPNVPILISITGPIICV